MRLLQEYEAWRSERADLSAQEEANFPLGPDDGPQTWEASDDQGCDLAQQLAEAYRELAETVSEFLSAEAAEFPEDTYGQTIDQMREACVLALGQAR